ncbi:hypothetical protein EGX44_21060 [Yersinia pseudotuberculosis]|nr:hypothetical protein EGX44_21060 [Yersinia pseudotuberculosis]
MYIGSIAIAPPETSDEIKIDSGNRRVLRVLLFFIFCVSYLFTVIQRESAFKIISGKIIPIKNIPTQKNKI